MALNNWERHMRAVDRPREHAQHLLAQPKRLEILLDIFAASQFLAETLIQYPEFFDWVTDPELLHSRRTRNRLKHELIALGNAVDTHGEWLHTLRRFRRREILRIGTRDICLKAPMADITDELSALGDAVVAAALARIVANPDNELDPESSRHAGADFCVLALGKLGGGELNYSSDIDLVAVCSADAEPRDFEPVMEQLRSDLAMHTDAGIAYRVDLRLRPYGRSGSLVHRLPRLLQYYVEAAGLWEIQALLKLRYIAGDATLAEALLKGLRPLLETPRSLDEIATAIDEMRNKAVRKLDMGSIGKRDIKSGLGGIRDAEFLIQGLQLKHLAKAGDLLEGNTLRAADKLAAHGLLPADVTEQLKEDYIFLRRVEHCLQILEDRQVHALPRSGDALEALARRVMGPGTSGADLLTTLDACQERVRAAYKKHLGLPTETTN
jgi:glutamate-ammonia-ligase adenylyltransferase